MLNLCLNLMRRTGESFSTDATFFVHGVVISGTLIHPIAYFRGLAEVLDASKSDPDSANRLISKTMTENIDKTLDRSHKGSRDTKQTEIYLTDVKIWNPPSSLAIKNAFLALHIDAIDGFIWGIVGVENNIPSS